jgi:undecaprenyl diphosphate synthase
VAAVRRVVERSLDAGVSRLTLYAFSSDNWRRPAAEVQSIFWLLRAFLRLEAKRLRQQGVQLRIIGRRDRLSHSVLHEIEKAEQATAEGTRLKLCIAIDYSSRDAISRAAVNALAGSASEERPSTEWLRNTLTNTLSAEGRDVDLLIRTGGEQRLSDFLLWEAAYAELVFTHRMWPDFDGNDLDAALAEFKGRERRFGGVFVPENDREAALPR